MLRHLKSPKIVERCTKHNLRIPSRLFQRDSSASVLALDSFSTLIIVERSDLTFNVSTLRRRSTERNSRRMLLPLPPQCANARPELRHLDPVFPSGVLL
jgi:hypothetical protein